MSDLSENPGWETWVSTFGVQDPLRAVCAFCDEAFEPIASSSEKPGKSLYVLQDRETVIQSQTSCAPEFR